MKKIITLIIGMLPILLLSQIPQAFNYQATVRNAEGEIQTNAIQDFEIEILFEGATIYSEQHPEVNSGSIGVVNFKIGLGQNPTTNFSEINWAQGQHQIRVKLNGEEMGLADIVAVPFALYAQESGNNYWNKQDTSIYYPQGRIGIGINSPLAKLHIINRFENPHHIEGASTFIIGPTSGNINTNLRMGVHEDYSWIQSHGSEPLSINPIGNNVGIGTSDPQEKLHVNGTTKTCVLEITGGCDIKENLNSTENLEPGDIVVIDEQNPGKLKRTNIEYDKKVAGVISGAKGINFGISLSQDGVLEGEYPLTMLGQVYVKVKGRVEIGDMLTTSSSPGLAMAVNDFSLAHGTVIGKAMTANEKGENLVLVLVNLQ